MGLCIGDECSVFGLVVSGVLVLVVCCVALDCCVL